MAQQDQVGGWGHLCLDVLFWRFTPEQCSMSPSTPTACDEGNTTPSVEWNIPTEVRWMDPGPRPVTGC